MRRRDVEAASSRFESRGWEAASTIGVFAHRRDVLVSGPSGPGYGSPSPREDYAPLTLVLAQTAVREHNVFAENLLPVAAKPQAANKRKFHTYRQMGPKPGVVPLAAWQESGGLLHNLREGGAGNIQYPRAPGERRKDAEKGEAGD